MDTGYMFWKNSTNRTPEAESGGHGVGIVPGLGDWVLLHPSHNPMPKDAIPVEEVVGFLNSRAKSGK
jgi:hypothetical protein